MGALLRNPIWTVVSATPAAVDGTMGPEPAPHATSWRAPGGCLAQKSRLFHIWATDGAAEKRAPLALLTPAVAQTFENAKFWRLGTHTHLLSHVVADLACNMARSHGSLRVSLGNQVRLTGVYGLRLGWLMCPTVRWERFWGRT